MNLATLLERSAARAPEKTALVCEGRRISYRELHVMAQSLAASCCRHGLGRGSRVAVLGRNSIEYVAALFGLMEIGAVCIPLNTRLTGYELSGLLEHCRPSALLYDRASEKKLSEIAELPSVTRNLEANIGPRKTLTALTATADWGDPAVILYTAGTTGAPKGVVLTHGNLLWNTINYTAAYRMHPSDIELAPTPLFHTSTLGRVFTYVFNTVTFILTPSFDPHECLELIQREKVTSITQVPTMYQKLYEAAQRGCYDLHSVRRAVTGAAPMHAVAKKRLAELFPSAAWYDLYGLTEASPGVTISGPEDFLVKPESVGRPMLTVRLAVVDDQNRALDRESIGEIVCRGPNVMQGYYRDPETTACALRDGWLHTGDEGFIDREGCLYIVGRKKEIIITGGVNVYPGEVEQVLSRHPAVSDVAVVGTPDSYWGEKVVAAVVLRAGSTVSTEDLLDFCRQHLAGFKCPKELFFLDSLPRNAAQKVVRRDLLHMLQPLAHKASTMRERTLST